MNILVIGGSGFLGSHVCDELVKEGHNVRVLDLVDSPLLDKEHEMIKGDFLDEKILKEAVKGCNIVYNFAGQSDLNYTLDKPIETVIMNVLGNVKVLEMCLLEGVDRYIYASTLYVFSREGGFYRCSKQSAEHYIEEYKRTYNLDYTILRFGSLYGPRSDNRNGMWNIVKSAIENNVLEYVGDGEAIRDYIHVGDAARSSVDILRKDFCNQHVLITGQQPIKIIDLLKMLGEILGLPNSSIKFNEADYEGHYSRTPYAYQPKLGLKYNPPMHVDLGQGLLQLIEEINNN